MGIKVKAKRLHYRVKIDGVHTQLSFYYYNGGGRALVGLAFSLILLFATISIPPIPFVWLILVGILWFLLLAFASVWRFDARNDTFQKSITYLGLSFADTDFPRNLFIHLKFDLKIVLKSLKKIPGMLGPLVQKYDNLDALARDLKDQLQKADFGTASIQFHLYSKGARAKDDKEKVDIPLPEIEIYIPDTGPLRASTAPLNEIFSALLPPRTQAFLVTFSRFYPVTDTFFVGNKSKLKNSMALQLRRGTRPSSTASSGWWDFLEWIAAIGDIIFFLRG